MSTLIHACIFTPERQDHSHATYKWYAIVKDERYEAYNNAWGTDGDSAGILVNLTQEAFETILSLEIQEIPSVLEKIVEEKRAEAFAIIGIMEERFRDGEPYHTI
jgi:hypothetical protein